MVFVVCQSIQTERNCGTLHIWGYFVQWQRKYSVLIEIHVFVMSLITFSTWRCNVICCRIPDGTDLQRKHSCRKWKEKNVDWAVTDVMRRDVHSRSAMSLFQIPYSTLKYRLNINTAQKAARDQLKTKSAGHPTVFSVG